LLLCREGRVGDGLDLRPWIQRALVRAPLDGGIVDELVPLLLLLLLPLLLLVPLVLLLPLLLLLLPLLH
jgi:hypothetical protein